MFIAANTRQPATGSGVTEYFEMVYPRILPSANMTGCSRAGHNYV